MKYKTGQEIICVQNKSWSNCSLRKGDVYTVKDTYKCKCGSKQVILEEEYFQISMTCQCGRSEYRYQSYYNWRFRPCKPS